MRYVQRLNKDVSKDVNKGNEVCTKMLNKDVNKGNEVCTKAKQRCKQRCKQRQWGMYKG